jgi:flagellar protein FlaI
VKNNERRAYRRVLNVNEIADYEDYRSTFKWHPSKDEQIPQLDKSVMLSGISERIGWSKQDLLDEIERRKNVLQWMKGRNIRSYKDVAAIIAEYYARPKQIYEKVLAGEEVKMLAASKNP